MEATGTYHYKLAFGLHRQGKDVMVLNPLKVSHWIESQSNLANDDGHAAINIASFAAVKVAQGVDFWQPFPPKIAKARAIVTLLKRCSKIQIACSNVNHALSYFVGSNDSLLNVLPDFKDMAEEKETPLEKELCKAVKDIYPEQFKLLQTVPGIAAKTAGVFCVLTKGMEGFSNCKQLTAFVGLAPRFHESGTSIKSKRRISKTGNPYLRGLLFMCALTAVKYNKPCNDLYERLLRKGRDTRVAQTAVMHKLVKIAFGVVKSGEPYKGGRVA
jgi:transposase